jgi:hypothetical protein
MNFPRRFVMKRNKPLQSEECSPLKYQYPLPEPGTEIPARQIAEMEVAMHKLTGFCVGRQPPSSRHTVKSMR